jgi:hypothetical protein
VKEIEITVQFVQKMFVTGDTTLDGMESMIIDDPIKFLEREWDDEQIVNVSVEETGKHL